MNEIWKDAKGMKVFIKYQILVELKVLDINPALGL